MENSMLIDVLGKRFSILTTTYHFPKLTPAMIRKNTYLSFTHQLPALPSNVDRLKRKIIDLIHSAEIQEVEQIDSTTRFLLCFEYREERWLIELTYSGQAWTVGDLLYHGKSPKKKLKKVLVPLAALFLLGVPFAVYYILSGPTNTFNVGNERGMNGYALIHKNTKMHAQPPSNQAEQTDPIELEEIDVHSPVDQIAQGNDTNQGEEEVGLYKPGEDHDSNTSSEELIALKVEAGMSGIEVAKLLEQYGLVETQEEMIELLKSLEIQGKIQTGTFFIPEHSTLLDIVHIITEKPTRR